jgi:hypothetical protein
VRATDKLVAAVVAALLLVGVVYLMLVSPERSQASSLSAQIATEQAALSAAQASLASERTTVASYGSDVKELAQVANAVPVNIDEPSMIRTFTRLAGTTVDVHGLAVGGPTAVTQGPTALGLTFTFNATYGSLQSFIAALDRLVGTDGTNIVANGRLFTITGVALSPNNDKRSTTKATVTGESYSQTPGIFASAAAATGATGASSTAAVTP